MKDRLRRVFEAILKVTIEQNRGINPLPKFCFIIQLPTKEGHILNGYIPIGTVWIRLPELRQYHCLVGLHHAVEVITQTECFELYSPTSLVPSLLCPGYPDHAALIALREITKNQRSRLSASRPINHQQAQVKVLLGI